MRALAVLLLISLLLGCVTSEKPVESTKPTTPPQTTPAPQEKVYRSENLSFEARYPANWRVVVDRVGNATLVFFLAPRSYYGTANINVGRENTSLPLEEYVAAMKSNAAELLNNYTILSEGGRKVSGYEAYELVYTYVQGPYTIKNHAVFVKAGDAIYLITLGTAPEEYEKNERVFERFLESFKIW